jgi:hypothetical protein
VIMLYQDWGLVTVVGITYALTSHLEGCAAQSQRRNGFEMQVSTSKSVLGT